MDYGITNNPSARDVILAVKRGTYTLILHTYFLWCFAASIGMLRTKSILLGPIPIRFYSPTTYTLVELFTDSDFALPLWITLLISVWIGVHYSRDKREILALVSWQLSTKERWISHLKTNRYSAIHMISIFVSRTKESNETQWQKRVFDHQSLWNELKRIDLFNPSV